MFKKLLNLNSLSTFLLYLSILIFIISFNFSDNRSGGWYQQFLPDINGASIRDITFTDSLNGYIVTSIDGSNSYILKTTDGGDNWTIKFLNTEPFVRVMFINDSTGFTNAFQTIFKTTNKGENWTSINLPGDLFGDDMFVLNEETIWLVNANGFVGGVFRTTNGGINWTQQFNGGNNPDKIYMFNSRIGFIGLNEFSISTKKTTDGGFKWFTVLNEGFTDMYFVDSLTGWKCNIFTVKETTNGGLNWITQAFPPGSDLLNGMKSFSNVNRDTIWGVGGIKQFGILNRGMIYRTTNGGSNWLYQVPDSNINIVKYSYNDFYNQIKGWAYSAGPGVHTIFGGDSLFYPLVNINHISSEVPEDFKLYQNYPNPFNPSTIISFKIKNPKVIKLIIYDIQAREISVLVNKKLNAGEYQYIFDAGSLSGGIYFYSFFIDEKIIDTKKMILVR